MSAITGKIVQVIGPVVDLEFAEGKLPNILNAILITNPTIDATEDNLVVEVRPASWQQRCPLHRHG